MIPWVAAGDPVTRCVRGSGERAAAVKWTLRETAGWSRSRYQWRIGASRDTL